MILALALILIPPTAAIAEKLNDVDDKVRGAVCKMLGSLDYETAAHHVTLETMRALGERLLDRKVARFPVTPQEYTLIEPRFQLSVCEEAFKGLGRLYDLAYPQMFVPEMITLATLPVLTCVTRTVTPKMLQL